MHSFDTNNCMQHFWSITFGLLRLIFTLTQKWNKVLLWRKTIMKRLATLAKLSVRKPHTSQLTQAGNYECFSQYQKYAGMQLIKKLKIKSGSTVLDLGCGTGSLAKVLSTQVGANGRVIAVDPDEKRLEIAVQKYSSANIEFIKANDKSFPLGKYDVVFCNDSIQWIRDKKGLYRRVYQNLLPGGCFAISTPDTSFPIPHIGEKFFDNLLGPGFLPRMNKQVMTYLSANDYKHMADDTGFQITSMSSENIVLYWTDLDHYIDAMYGWFGGEFDPSQLHENALNQLRKESGYAPISLPEPIKKLEFVLSKSF